jgi:serine/threonine protein kinase
VSVDVSHENFLDRLKESGLLSAEELDRALTALSTSTENPSPSLAQALIHDGVLTSFQMEAISRRAYVELRIGNYDVLDRLGAGGMGTVFKARHRRMKRVVALKVLPRSMAQDTTFLQRFQREVETIARLHHPNIVMAFDADEAVLKQNSATASVPIIMVTSETDPGKLKAIRQLGVTVCDKSFQRDIVRKIIEQIIGG